MTRLERVEQAVGTRNPELFLALADDFCADGRPEGPELFDLAMTIMESEDWSEVTVAATVFYDIVKLAEMEEARGK